MEKGVSKRFVRIPYLNLKTFIISVLSYSVLEIRAFFGFLVGNRHYLFGNTDYLGFLVDLW
jgi:hypothetical protein